MNTLYQKNTSSIYHNKDRFIIYPMYYFLPFLIQYQKYILINYIVCKPNIIKERVNILNREG